MTGRPVAILGGTGAVGRAAWGQLAAWGLGPFRVGGRDPVRVRRTAETDGLEAVEAVAVDTADAAGLARFCAGASLVVNCAGPAVDLGDRVVRVAMAAGVPIVDAAYDGPVDAEAQATPAAVLGAGLMPGLSGLLPRCLADLTPTEGGHMVGYIGGRDRFTLTAATDYLAGSGSGESLAAWRGGAVRPRALATLTGLTVPQLPEPVTAHPFLSTETQRLARRLGLRDADWYSVFAGDRVLAAMRAGTDADAARRLRDAAELDLFGRRAYHMIVATVNDTTVVLRGIGASALTGAAAALAARAVLAGEVPAGVHFAAEILDPGESLRRLRTCAAVEELTVSGATIPASELVEEGVL